MLKFISIGVWALQAIMAIVVLALSVELIKGQRIGDSPTTTRYSAFTGGFGLAVALFGIVSVFFEAIPALIVMAVDAVSGLLLLAGGIAIAIGLRGTTCDPTTQDDWDKLQDNDLVNRGKAKVDGKWGYGSTSADQLLDNCKKATADQAMQFVTFGFALATIVLVCLVWKKGRSGSGRTYV
ncbi:hypothetical protein CPLU01_03898 [Colletotrichum plurivorum]|uniref:MARVEL domain-containing protein n=1 Tax=Colletotrichum plurivorum TaxID=2175906 RepID=A0A8H6KRJ2_9PEZI|nr:hypothetical protein CPLU01_03898 [Colletotrichum plurivorum]